MATVRELIVKITTKISGQQEMMQLNEAVDKFVNGMHRATKAVFEFGKGMLDSAGNIEQTRVALDTLLGSSEAASDHIESMFEMVAESPFQMKGAMRFSQQLIAVGESADEARDTMMRLGDIAAGTGRGTTAMLGRVIHAYTQLRENQVVSLEVLRSLRRNGIPIMRELGETVGITGMELRKAIKGNQVSFEAFRKTIERMTNEGGMFFEMQKKQAKTYFGIMQNIGDVWDRIGVLVGDEVMPAIKTFLTAILEYLKANKEIIATGIAAFFKGLLFVFLGLASIIELIVIGFELLFGWLNEITNGEFAKWLVMVVDFLGVFIGIVFGALAAIAAFLGAKAIIGTIIAVVGALVVAVGWLPILIGLAVAAVIALAIVIVKHWTTIVEWTKWLLKTIWEGFLFFLDQMKQWGLFLLKILIWPYMMVWNFIKDVFTKGISQAFINLFDSLKQLFFEYLKIITAPLRFVLGLFGKNVGTTGAGTENNISPNQLNRPGTTNNNTKKEVNVKIDASPGVDMAQRENMEKVAKEVFEERSEQERDQIAYNSRLVEA